MHERALRRGEKVVRRGRVPRWVRRAGANDASAPHTDTDAQSGTAPHRAPKRRTRGWRRPWPYAEPKPKPELMLLLRLLLLRLLLLLRRGTPRRGAVSGTWRAEAAPPGRGTDTDAGIAANDAAIRHDFVVIGRERRRAQHAFGAWRATHG